jgi:outer membrane protein
MSSAYFRICFRALFRLPRLVVASVLLMTASFASLAQADAKVGFVNQERIMRESAPAKRAQAKLEKEFATRKTELDKMEKQGRDLEAMLQKEGVTLPEAERSARERQLTQLTRDFQRLSREFREDLNLRKSEELVSLQERANKVIIEIAEKEKFDLIVQEAVYASARIDITEKVLKALADK